MEQEKAAQAETVINILLSELYPFPNQPFKVRDDEEMQKMVESVREYGIITPAAVRSRTEGGYEIIAGHRRKRACELAGVNFLPAVVRDLDDDTATIFMVDSNIQREDILPSEKAQAYKMKLDAMRRRAGRPSKENSVQLGQNFQGMTSRELLAENSPDSSTQIQRFIRLTELSSELQKMVDDGNIAMTTAVELSFLKAEEQALLVESIEHGQEVPTLAQAKQLKKVSQTSGLDRDAIQAVLSDDAPPKQAPVMPPEDVPTKPSQPAEGPASPPKPERKRRQIAADILELKDTTKDCRCTPDSFLSTFQAVAIRLAREIEVFTMPHYEAVFPSLTPEQLDLLNRHINIIRTAADNFYNKVKGMNEHE